MPCTRPRREFRLPMMSPAHSSGTYTSTCMMGSSRTGLVCFHGLLERQRAGDLEGHFGGVDVVVGTVQQGDLEIHHRVAGQIAALGRLDDAFLDGRDVLPRDGAAEDLVLELEAAAARQGLHGDDAIAELAVAAGLLLVPPLDLRLGGDRFSVGDLGRLRFTSTLYRLFIRSMVTSTCSWPVPEISSSLVWASRWTKIMGSSSLSLVRAVADLLLVAAALGLDGEGDRRLGILERRDDRRACRGRPGCGRSG